MSLASSIYALTENIVSHLNQKNIFPTYNEDFIGLTSLIQLISNINTSYDFGLAIYFDDNNNQENIRPNTIVITRNTYCDGVLVDTEEYTESVTSSLMTFTYESNTYDEEVFSIQSISGYSLTSNDNNYIVLTHEPEVISRTFLKVWNDNNNNDGRRPANLAVDLKSGSESIGTYILNDSNNWTVTVNNLPKYSEGNEIIYTWREQAVLGYILESTTVINDVTTITNTLYTPGPRPPSGPTSL